MSYQCGQPKAPSCRLTDPKYPQRCRLAYEFYYEENPPPYYMAYYEEADRFKRLPEDQRAKYEQVEKEDRERYEMETSNYKPGSGWINPRSGDYDVIVDWDGGYLPRSGIFPAEGGGGADAKPSAPIQKKQKVASNHLASWSDLHAEIVSVIASFLDHPRDAFSMCYTCSHWKHALSDPESVAQEAVWKPLARSRFPHLFEDREGPASSRRQIFALKGTRFTYRDVFIVHDQIIAMDHNAELAVPNEFNQIHQEGLEEKDFMMTYVLTHYSRFYQYASQYTFGMGTLGTMEQTAYVPNFHKMILSTDFNSDRNGEPIRDRSTFPVLRCFLTGPGYRTTMIFKFTSFHSEWGGEGYYYRAYYGDDGNATLPDTLHVSGGAIQDYQQDDLRFGFEYVGPAGNLGDLFGAFAQLVRGQDPNLVPDEGDTETPA